MIFSLLAFGTLWFWIVTALFVVTMLALTEYEKPFWATITLLIFLSLITTFSVPEALGWVAANLSTIAMWFGIYLVTGVVWAAAKWWFYLLNQREIYETKREKFLNDQNPVGPGNPVAIDTTNRDKFLRTLDKKFPPLPSENKSRIILWMSYWPFSAAWTLVNDPLKRLWRFLYTQISATLERMSRSVFSKYESDFER